jgi:AcrR family transcriptional regulator
MRTKDRRVHQTRSLLHQALVSLIREKPYDSIAVKEILNQANVGRSTFYIHFRDKDELLASGIHNIIGSLDSAVLASSGKAYERLIGFSLPIFQHIQLHKESGEAHRGIAIIHEYLRKVIAERIADDVRKFIDSGEEGRARFPPNSSFSFWHRHSHSC